MCIPQEILVLWESTWGISKSIRNIFIKLFLSNSLQEVPNPQAVAHYQAVACLEPGRTSGTQACAHAELHLRNRRTCLQNSICERGRCTHPQLTQMELHLLMHTPAIHMEPFPLPHPPGWSAKLERLGMTALQVTFHKVVLLHTYTLAIPKLRVWTIFKCDLFTTNHKMSLLKSDRENY